MDNNNKIADTSLGLKVIRFTNEQVLFDVDNVLDKIEKEIKQQING